MDLDRMLELCRKGQWKVDDLDWTVKPRAMSRDEEMAIVQYFTDMAGVERLAGELFDEQRKRAESDTLKKIFATFVADEERHARTAERLARHYDVHRFKSYVRSAAMETFHEHFVNAVRYFSAEVANVYITVGELILDVALLRSLNDYVHDSMSQHAMDLINRDESRHIAIDYYMTEYYSSPRYQEWLNKQPHQPIVDRLKAAWAFANILRVAKPFFHDVFFRPMALIDPSGNRLREALKRSQLLGSKADVAARPFWRFLTALRLTVEHPVLGPVFGGLASSIMGVPREMMTNLCTESELQTAARMSYDDLAGDALAAKND